MKAEPQDWVDCPSAAILTVNGREAGQEVVSSWFLMTQVTSLFPRVQVMLPLGALKAGMSLRALAGAGALSVGVAEALGVADVLGEADVLLGVALARSAFWPLRVVGRGSEPLAELLPLPP